jgi:hypothetical protein
MLKKIFAVFFAGVFFVAGANAAIDERGKCVLVNRAFGYVNNPSDEYMWPEMMVDYAIFFDNDKSDIPADCVSDVNKIIDDLATKKGDIETVLLFGSADSTGSSKHNVELAQKRMNTLRKMLDSAGVPVCEYDGANGELAHRCAQISIGESLNLVDDDISYWRERAVFMFVINKGDICDESTIKALDELIKVLPSEQKLKDARNLCENQNDLLLRSQRKQIMDAMLSAIQNYPEKTKNIELPADLSVSMLVNGVIAVRDSLAASASVWKKADGSFNTARLASDSIAGVVLGTAGGLITSNVVKKNQLSNGFENIMCTVGGQSVATYGDEFSVGIRAK